MRVSLKTPLWMRANPEIRDVLSQLPKSISGNGFPKLRAESPGSQKHRAGKADTISALITPTAGSHLGIYQSVSYPEIHSGNHSRLDVVGPLLDGLSWQGPGQESFPNCLTLPCNSLNRLTRNTSKC